MFKKIFLRLFFILTFSLIYFLIFFNLFNPIFLAKSLIFPFAVHPFDIVKKYSDYWIIFKKISILLSILFSIIFSNSLYSLIYYLLNKKSNFKVKANKLNNKKLNQMCNSDGLYLDIGNSSSGEKVIIPERGLYQNILVTGGIGSGKTSSFLYPITKQLINYSCYNNSKKLAFLVLDVKGNYHKFITDVVNRCGRSKDLIVIGLNHKTKYNPLDKPYLKPQVLANRLKTILTLFSPNNPETYWIDKSEQVICEAIKLCRLYNNNYVTFLELHKLISSPEYYKEKVEFLRNKFLKKKLSSLEIKVLISCLDFFDNEFFNLDPRVLSILKSEISRITNVFVSDPEISEIFCSPKSDLTFNGFSDVLKNGKIVVLDMNISEYSSLSKIIAAYLKLDFQAEILSQLSHYSNENIRTSCFICDEYHEYVTETDSGFFSQSREAKSINIVATQSYTSLLNSINNPNSTKVIIQSLINKFWFRTDDSFTIEEAQKQLGKEEKVRSSTTISENARSTKFNFLTSSLMSQDSNLSESINTYKQKDFLYDSNFFSQVLKTFSCLGFISDGNKILPPKQIFLLPYFKKI